MNRLPYREPHFRDEFPIILGTLHQAFRPAFFLNKQVKPHGPVSGLCAGINGHWKSVLKNIRKSESQCPAPKRIVKASVSRNTKLRQALGDELRDLVFCLDIDAD